MFAPLSNILQYLGVISYMRFLNILGLLQGNSQQDAKRTLTTLNFYGRKLIACTDFCLNSVNSYEWT